MPATTKIDPYKVYQSSNYDEFVLLKNNRELNKTHLNELEDAGNTSAASPIVVNEKMEVIDGQHRFEVCRRNKWAVYYIIREGATIEDSRAMNIFQRQWRVVDYAHSYAESGIQDYVTFNNLREEYDLPHTITLLCIDGNPFAKRLNKEFRHGEFRIANLEQAKTKLQQVRDFKELCQERPTAAMYKAYMVALNTPGFEHDRMMRKMSEVGERLMKQYASTQDAMRAMEDVYNHGRQVENHLRLF